MIPPIQKLTQQFKTYLLIQNQRSPHTANAYISDINQFFLIVNTSIDMVDKSTINGYIKELNALNLSIKSIHRKFSSLDHFFDYLIHIECISMNPWKQVRRPRLRSSVPNYIEESTILELLTHYPIETPEQIRNKAILELLFSSGIRVSECAHLNIVDVNFHLMECKITGKGDKERIVLFGDRCKKWITYYLDNAYPLWSPMATDAALFISKHGSRITQRTIQRIVKESNKYHSSSIEITPHTCRHSCASMLLTNGANIRDIQDILGHTSIITTQRYANIPTKKLKQRFLNVMDDDFT